MLATQALENVSLYISQERFKLWLTMILAQRDISRLFVEVSALKSQQKIMVHIKLLFEWHCRVCVRDCFDGCDVRKRYESSLLTIKCPQRWDGQPDEQ